MSRRAYWAVAALTLAARAMVAVGTGSFRAPMTWEYEVVTSHLLAGHGFVMPYMDRWYRAFQPPLYDWLSVAVYTIAGHHPAALLVLQACCSAALAVLCVVLAQRLGLADRWALAAGVLVALHPGLLYYDTHHLHPLSLGALLFAVCLWAAWRWVERGQWREALWLGAAVGLAMYERGTVGLFLLPALVWMAWWCRRQRWSWWRSGAALLAGFVIVVAPWTVRNYMVLGRPVLMISISSEHLWRGNNPQASGSNLTPDGRPILDVAPAALRERLWAQPTELAQQDVFWQEASRYIRQDPGAFVVRTARKLGYFFWFSPQSGLWYPSGYLHWYRLYYGVVAALALVGAWWSVHPARPPQARALAWALLALVMSVAAAQSICYVEGRHRWGVEPLLLLLAVQGASAVVVTVRDRVRGAATCPG